MTRVWSEAGDGGDGSSVVENPACIVYQVLPCRVDGLDLCLMKKIVLFYTNWKMPRNHFRKGNNDTHFAGDRGRGQQVESRGIVRFGGGFDPTGNDVGGSAAGAENIQ